MPQEPQNAMSVRRWAPHLGQDFIPAPPPLPVLVNSRPCQVCLVVYYQSSQRVQVVGCAGGLGILVGQCECRLSRLVRSMRTSQHRVRIIESRFDCVRSIWIQGEMLCVWFAVLLAVPFPLSNEILGPSGYCWVSQRPLPIEWALRISLPIEWALRSSLVLKKRCFARSHNLTAVHSQPPGQSKPGHGE
jgi:hypothetical protein